MSFYRIEYSVIQIRPFPFPVDMLRYDGSSPRSESDSYKTTSSIQRLITKANENLEIWLVHYSRDKDWRPNSLRWSSKFGWKVNQLRDPECLFTIAECPTCGRPAKIVCPTCG